MQYQEALLALTERYQAHSPTKALPSANFETVQLPYATPEKQTYLQAIFENTSDYAIFTLDLDGRITSWNIGAERIFGFTEAEAMGESASIIFTPEDQANGVLALEMAQARIEGKAEDDHWQQRKDGSRFFASGILQPLHDQGGRLWGYVKIARDFTEQKQTELTLRQQYQLIDALHEIALLLNSTLDLDKVLHYILTSVQRIVPHDAAAVMLVEGEIIGRVRTTGYTQLELAKLEKLLSQSKLKVNNVPLLQQVIQQRQPVNVKDIHTQKHKMGLTLPQGAHAYLAVPIVAGESNLGLLYVTSNQPHSFTETDRQNLEIFASQAALAVRNAQLLIKTQELVALQERQQIARDLHDSVTQSLFSARLIAESLVQEVDKLPQEAQGNLLLLDRLAASSLAEMRLLLLQLRPPDLVGTPLSVLLQQLATAIGGKKEIALEIAIQDEPRLAPEVHIALYRIAQEALNNVVKHAQASQVHVRMGLEGGHLQLVIHDNGQGRDPSKVLSGMGLRMMQERATAINAWLEISSPPEGGTQVMLVFPAPSAKKKKSVSS